MRLTVRVRTRSSCPGLKVGDGGVLVVKVKSPPVDGRANSELCKIIGAALGVPKRDVNVIRGMKSREKIVEIEGEDAVIKRKINGMGDS